MYTNLPIQKRTNIKKNKIRDSKRNDKMMQMLKDRFRDCFKKRNKMNKIRDYGGDLAVEGPGGSRLEVITKLHIQKGKKQQQLIVIYYITAYTTFKKGKIVDCCNH